MYDLMDMKLLIIDIKNQLLMIHIMNSLYHILLFSFIFMLLDNSPLLMLLLRDICHLNLILMMCLSYMLLNHLILYPYQFYIRSSISLIDLCKIIHYQLVESAIMDIMFLILIQNVYMYVLHHIYLPLRMNQM